MNRKYQQINQNIEKYPTQSKGTSIFSHKIIIHISFYCLYMSHIQCENVDIWKRLYLVRGHFWSFLMSGLFVYFLISSLKQNGNHETSFAVYAFLAWLAGSRSMIHKDSPSTLVGRILTLICFLFIYH